MEGGAIKLFDSWSYDMGPFDTFFDGGDAVLLKCLTLNSETMENLYFCLGCLWRVEGQFAPSVQNIASDVGYEVHNFLRLIINSMMPLILRKCGFSLDLSCN